MFQTTNQLNHHTQNIGQLRSLFPTEWKIIQMFQTNKQNKVQITVTSAHLRN